MKLTRQLTSLAMPHGHKRHLHRLLAAVACLTALGFGVSGWLLRARAELSNAMIDSGRISLRIGDALSQSMDRQLALNDARIQLSTGYAAQAPAELAAVVSRSCAAHNAEWLKGRGESALLKPLVLRTTQYGETGRGQALGACIALSAGLKNLEALIPALQLAARGDFRKLGELRYLYAEARPRSAKTHFAAFSAASLNLDFNAATKVPSQALHAGVLQPDASQHLLSFSEQGAPQALSVFRRPYQRTRAPWHDYAKALRKAGMQVLGSDDESHAAVLHARLREHSLLAWRSGPVGPQGTEYVAVIAHPTLSRALRAP